MSIPVSVTGGKLSAPATLEPETKPKEVDSAATTATKAKAALNTAIVQASLNVSISSGNEPLALLYKSAIEGINEKLAPTLGPDAIQNAAANQDNSADATADRIVKLSTAFYDAYRKQNGLEDNEDSRKQFIDVIQGGFEQGFKEAQDVLQGLKVLGGDIAAGIDKTHELVLKGFQDFLKVPARAEDSDVGGPARTKPTV